MRSFFLFVVLIITIEQCFASHYKQERATVDYCNTNYFSKCYIMTRRIKRGEPYKTNATFTTRYLGDNNITMRIAMVDTIIIDLVNVKMCDISKVDWMFAYLKKVSNWDGNCPIEPREYTFYNMEFPPKNFPRTLMSLLKDKFRGKWYFQATKTGEILAELTVTLERL